MTLSFWVIVGLFALGLWLLLCKYFIPLGNRILKKWKNLKWIMSDDNPDNNDHH